MKLGETGQPARAESTGGSPEKAAIQQPTETGTSTYWSAANGGLRDGGLSKSEDI